MEPRWWAAVVGKILWLIDEVVHPAKSQVLVVGTDPSLGVGILERVSSGEASPVLDIWCSTRLKLFLEMGEIGGSQPHQSEQRQYD